MFLPPSNLGLSAFITISVTGPPSTLCFSQKPMGPSKLCSWFVSYSTTICSPHTVSNQSFPIYTFKSMKYCLHTEEYIWYIIKQMFMYLHTALEVEPYMQKKYQIFCLTVNIKFNLIWTKNMNVWAKTIKLLKKI